MPTVTVAHWDPEIATTDPEHVDNKLLQKEPGEGTHPVAARAEHDFGVHPVIPVCPSCGAAVESYHRPGKGAITGWESGPVVHLRPCNHRVETPRIGIPRRYELAPRP